MPELSKHEYQRYLRHLQLPAVGSDGQQKLKHARAVIVGCGGLGAPVSLYLAASGVGRITLVDGDDVALANLQRQVVFREDDININKATAAGRHLRALNSDIEIDAVPEHLDFGNAARLLEGASIVLDCSDNFAARYLINDSCRELSIPWVFASVFQFSGQCATFLPGAPCFRCLFPTSPVNTPDCDEAGVLGVLPGMLGTIQANNALRILLQLDDDPADQLLLVESEDMSIQKITRRHDASCLCAAPDYEYRNRSEYQRQACAAGFSGDAPPNATNALLLPATEFNRYQARNDVLVIDVRDSDERAAFHLGGEHIPVRELQHNANLPVEKILLLYCQSGARSLQACQQLAARGYTALSVDGGLAALVDESDAREQQS